MELNSNNRVTYIELESTSSSTSKLTGEIWDMETTGTLRITIVNDDRDRLTYVVDSDVEVRRDNSFINFNRLTVGERVKLELNSRDRVNYIEVVAGDYDSIKGDITDLVIGSSPQVFLKRSNGSVNRYYISDRAVIRVDGENVRLRDIMIGSYAELRLERGDVVRIDVIDDKDVNVSGTVANINTNNSRITIKQLNGNEFTFTLTNNADIRDDRDRKISLHDVRDGWSVTLELSNGRVSRLTRD
jgi:predicted RNA-binding protein